MTALEPMDYSTIDITDTTPVGVLTEAQRDLLAAMENRMVIDREFPNYDTLKKKSLPKLGREFYDYCLKDKRFAKAMEWRGLGRFIPSGAGKQTEADLTKHHKSLPLLTAAQYKFINAMMDPHETRRPNQVLKDLELDSKTYQMWLKDPVFREFYHSQARELLGEYMPEVRSALQRKAANGDINAIKLALEMTGEWSDKPDKDFNPMWFVSKILDILQRNVNDTTILDNIAAEFKQLLTGAGVQPVGLPAAVIEQPRLAPVVIEQTQPAVNYPELNGSI